MVQPLPPSLPQVAVSVMSIHGSSEDPKMLTKRAEGVKAYFQARMGLAPVEESRAYISYLVERKREADLISFLKELEQVRELGERGRLAHCDFSVAQVVELQL